MSKSNFIWVLMLISSNLLTWITVLECQKPEVETVYIERFYCFQLDDFKPCDPMNLDLNDNVLASNE